MSSRGLILPYDSIMILTMCSNTVSESQIYLVGWALVRFPNGSFQRVVLCLLVSATAYTHTHTNENKAKKKFN